MTEQWFLDLDGMRSGPYQTKEVLGLIADGEVLPHHRISQTLKDSPWQTILDWRLEQARQIHLKRNPIPSPTPASAPSPVPDPVTKTEPVITPVAVEIEIKREPKVIESAESDEALPPPIPTFSAGQADFLKEVEQMEKTLAQIPVEGSKRDPMSEMFDLIQNTKHKREAKQLLSAQQASEEEKLGSKKPQNIYRLVAACIAVSIFGLILGQWFQKSTTPPPSQTESKTQTTTETKPEVIDRSTEKMTIRAVVEKKPDPTPARPVTSQSRPAPTPEPEPGPPSQPIASSPEDPSSEKKGTDKDLEELRDLKKELQELKALKEELKNTPLSDEFNEGDLGPYPDNAGGSFGGTSGYPQGNQDPMGNPENPGNPASPKVSPPPEDIRY